jgi:hypothetical protein
VYGFIVPKINLWEGSQILPKSHNQTYELECSPPFHYPLVLPGNFKIKTASLPNYRSSSRVSFLRGLQQVWREWQRWSSTGPLDLDKSSPRFNQDSMVSCRMILVLSSLACTLLFPHGVNFSRVLVTTKVTMQSCVLDCNIGSYWPVCPVNLLGEFI